MPVFQNTSLCSERVELYIYGYFSMLLSDRIGRSSSAKNMIGSEENMTLYVMLDTESNNDWPENAQKNW